MSARVQLITERRRGAMKGAETRHDTPPAQHAPRMRAATKAFQQICVGSVHTGGVVLSLASLAQEELRSTRDTCRRTPWCT